MPIVIPKKTTYETPEGAYRVVVSDAFEIKGGTLRIVFEITSLTHKVQTYVAGKNYPPAKSQLADDLFRWLGPEKTQELVKEDGTMDIEKLKGLEADIQVVHINNEQHEKPFVYLSEIHPPGTLIREIIPVAA